MTMEKVTIPTTRDPFVVWVNGEEYVYKAGETVEVPEEVAVLIRQMQRGPSLPPFNGGSSSGSGGGSGGGADLLNENGIIKQQHLPIGYPYSETVRAYILNETSPLYMGDGAFMLDTTDADPISGEIYTINWNGTDYECLCSPFDSDGDGIEDVFVFGNMVALGGEDTGEPFVAMFGLEGSTMRASGMLWMFMAFDGSETLTVSVEGSVEKVTQIDERYVPVKAFVVDVDYGGSALALLELTGGHISQSINKISHDFSTIKAAIDSGTLVTARIVDEEGGYLYIPLEHASEDIVVFASTYICGITESNNGFRLQRLCLKATATEYSLRYDIFSLTGT